MSKSSHSLCFTSTRDKRVNVWIFHQHTAITHPEITNVYWVNPLGIGILYFQKKAVKCSRYAKAA